MAPLDVNPGRGTGWWRLVMVAVVATVGVAIAAAWWLGRPRPGTAPTEPALLDAVGSALSALGQSESEFVRARDELLAALERRQSELAPATMVTIRDNLGVVDGAILDLARALERDPKNPRLTRLLAAACRKELELLRQAAELPATATSASD